MLFQTMEPRSDWPWFLKAFPDSSGVSFDDGDGLSCDVDYMDLESREAGFVWVSTVFIVEYGDDLSRVESKRHA
jgi:hypothetical protein